jgi:hypothetical protein
VFIGTKQDNTADAADAADAAIVAPTSGNHNLALKNLSLREL